MAEYLKNVNKALDILSRAKNTGINVQDARIKVTESLRELEEFITRSKETRHAS